MGMTRKDFLAGAAGIGALSAVGADKFWLPRDNALREGASGGGLMRGVAARLGMVSGGGDDRSLAWLDGFGFSYIPRGEIVAYAGISCEEDYIPVVGGHLIIWRYSENEILATNKSSLIVYDAIKNSINYWTANSASGYREFYAPAATAYMRISVKTSYKQNCYLQDVTTGQYLVLDGKKNW